MTKWKRLRLIVAFLASVYLAQMFIQMGWVKFDPEGFWTPAFERWGYPVWMRLGVGAAEVVGGLALLVPWIASWGAALLGFVMVGAIYTRAGDGRWVDVAWVGLYLTVLAWIAFEWWHRRIPRPAPDPSRSPVA